MNRLNVVVILTLAFAGSLCKADFVEELQKMASDAKPGPQFEEDHVGYDLHKDMFYYVDSTVDAENRKEIYMSTRVTLGGQQADLTGREVKGAMYPFAIAQKSYTRFRPNLNRFDVRDSDQMGAKNGHFQYIGIYSGNRGSYVVNKLRAHLLRQLANSINHLLPVLDRTARPDSKGHQEAADVVRDHLVETIQQVLTQVDDSIRGSMADSDDTSASANVVIVTDEFVVTATMGAGRVLAYNYNCEVKELTGSKDKKNSADYLFGDRRDRKGQSKARVKITPRNQDGAIQLLLIESPRAAQHLRNVNPFNMVLEQVNQHKRLPYHEQELFSSAVNRLMDSIGDGTKFFNRVFGNDNDAIVALIGLTRDYESIH